MTTPDTITVTVTGDLPDSTLKSLEGEVVDTVAIDAIEDNPALAELIEDVIEPIKENVPSWQEALVNQVAALSMQVTTIQNHLSSLVPNQLNLTEELTMLRAKILEISDKMTAPPPPIVETLPAESILTAENPVESPVENQSVLSELEHAPEQLAQEISKKSRVKFI